jgi:hypothetical protein
MLQRAECEPGGQIALAPDPDQARRPSAIRGAAVRAVSPAARDLTWLLGDCRGPLRDPLDLLRATFLLGAVIILLAGDFNNALRLGLTFALVLGARRLNLPRIFDLAFLLGMALQAWGNTLSLFEDVSGYDKAVHFALPLAVAPVLYILLIRLDAAPDLADASRRHHYLGIAIISISLGFCVGALYELYEWFAVHAFSANLEIGYEDTIADLGDDLIGSTAGALLLVGWAKVGWGTSRRIPGEAAKHRLE